MAKTLRLILGDQLNSNHSWFKKQDNNNIYLIAEVMQEQEYVMHHIQKILAFFAAMRNFSHQLDKQGHKVIYLELDDPENTQDFEQNIKRLIAAHHITRFEYQRPDEYRLDEQLKNICHKFDIETGSIDTEHFMTTRYELKEFFGDRNYLMENFYRNIRTRTGILMQPDGKPTGGKWNFDHENRNKYDGKAPLIDTLKFDHNVAGLKKMIDKQKVKYFGSVDEEHLGLPLSRGEALKLIDYFCENLLPHFGTYEDAMLKHHISLFHSRISFAQNVKMIAPAEIVHKVLTYWNKHQSDISIAQVEGYIRQIIGWREFMRGVYWAKMPDYQKLNFFNHQTKVPGYYWTGGTKMTCMRKCLGQSLEHAWAHHIQRLMVIGNFSLISGLHPDGVDEWYLGVYVDALQWVEITNTRGMSQFADGGIIASKPYAASAAYINKMSDYCKGCHYDYKKKYGENACPFNSLYWDFFDRNREKLLGNPRIGMMFKLWDKFDPHEKLQINNQAAYYLAHLEQL